MRSVCGTAALAAAVSCCSSPTCADASNWNRHNTPHYLLYAGFDLWRAGGFGHGGLLWSPQGLNESGFTLKLLFGAGAYTYGSGQTDIEARQFVASAMPGWRIKSGTFELTAYAGLDLQRHRMRPDDPASRLAGAHAGLRGGVEFWWEPAANAMVTGAFSFATIGSGYAARVATGWRLAELVWIGPEVSASGDTDYNQVRLGAHLTGFTVHSFEWSGALGYVRDSDDRSGLYGRVGLLTRR